MTISKTWIEQLTWEDLFPVHDFVDVKATKKVNDTQHGGTHYKQFKGCEPWDVITAWKLGYLDGTALKYIARWRDKGGIEDLKKAIHFLQKTIEVEEAKANGVPGTIG
jgi:hypothetical protein